MTSPPTPALLLCLLALTTLGCSEPTPRADDAADAATQAPDQGQPPADAAVTPATVRVATFNASLFRDRAGALAEALAGGQDEQARKVAEVLQRVRPDVVLLNEFDWDAEGQAARLFVEGYLAVAQGGAEPLDYPYRYVPPTNTGLHSGVDLDQNGQVDDTPGDQGYGGDAHGFGLFHGQYGMLVLSRYPIQADQIRTFQTLRWQDMPDNLLPTDFYGAEAQAALRLSSKNHVDVPVDIGGRTLHVLASHPTPPSFDGPEDRNGRRNQDEIRFWTDYLNRATYITDDAGAAGGLAPEAPFVLLGDLNSDPNDGDSRRQAIAGLIGHERVQDPQQRSEGAVAASARDGGANASHTGDPGLDTADFSDRSVGNLRIDFALPSANLEVADAGVFWPSQADPLARLATVSDHHLVWVDLTWPPSR